MRASRIAIVIVCGTICVGGHSATSSARQLNHVTPARAPCSVLSGHPCHPSFCSVFQRGPCFPEFLPPIGQDLRLTIVSTDENDPTNKKTEDTDQKAGDTKGGEDLAKKREDPERTTDDHALDTIRSMFAALRECWVPPPKDEARHGMEYTIRFAFKRDGEVVAPPRMTYVSHEAPAEVRTIYRDSIDAALKRCTPLHFSEGMGGAVAGRPIAIRFVDDRTIDKDTAK
jgi:hypothetical protein